jgi:uncharacterized membrane protein
MHPNALKLVFAISYLVLDLIYVGLSKAYYEAVAIGIQGKPFTQSRWMGGVLAYTALVIGWWFFATKLAETLSQRVSPIIAGALAGALYGFVVYGVFNGTMYVMFDGYDISVVLRDLIWGTISALTITALYSVVANSKNK